MDHRILRLRLLELGVPISLCQLDLAVPARPAHPRGAQWCTQRRAELQGRPTAGVGPVADFVLVVIGAAGRGTARNTRNHGLPLRGRHGHFLQRSLHRTRQVQDPGGGGHAGLLGPSKKDESGRREDPIASPLTVGQGLRLFHQSGGTSGPIRGTAEAAGRHPGQDTTLRPPLSRAEGAHPTQIPTAEEADGSQLGSRSDKYGPLLHKDTPAVPWNMWRRPDCLRRPPPTWNCWSGRYVRRPGSLLAARSPRRPKR